MKIIYFVNEDKAFLKQRLHFALFLKEKGHEVHVLSKKSALTPKIQELGFHYHDIGIHRSGINPISELNTLKRIINIYCKIKPKVSYCASIKPILYGTIAGRFSSIPKIVNLINGMGLIFGGRGFKNKILRLFIETCYKIIFASNKVTLIVQNKEDGEFLINNRIAKVEQVKLIRGSGVDTEDFPYSTPPKLEEKNFTFIGRLLFEKGIYDLLDAGEKLYQEGYKFKITLVGDIDPDNPHSLTKEELNEIKKKPFIHFIGFTNKVYHYIKNASCIVLPTFYREGLPLSLLEAASTGRMIITTDRPGCNDIVQDEVNGFLFEAQNSNQLKKIMSKVCNLKDESITHMGLLGRKRVEDFFSKEIINEETYELFEIQK